MEGMSSPAWMTVITYHLSPVDNGFINDEMNSTLIRVEQLVLHHATSALYVQ